MIMEIKKFRSWMESWGDKETKNVNVEKTDDERKNNVVDKFEGFEDVEDIVTARGRGSWLCC